MKLHELFENRLLLESVTLNDVISTGDLIDRQTGEYYTGVVNVTGDVSLSHSGLTKLPVQFGTVRNFYCPHNQLTSLEGAPSTVSGGVNYFNNKLTSLQGIHKIFKKVDDWMGFANNPITSGGIGLILIEGLKEIVVDPDLPAFDIIAGYLGQGKKGVLLCQDELIEAGYEEFAKL